MSNSDGPRLSQRGVQIVLILSLQCCAMGFFLAPEITNYPLVVFGIVDNGDSVVLPTDDLARTKTDGAAYAADDTDSARTGLGVWARAVIS